VLVVLHRLLGAMAYFAHGFGVLIKGKPVVLVQEGARQYKNMRGNQVSTHDLEEDNRGFIKNQTARLERKKAGRTEGKP
jgi:uncharacterized membrane protein YcaP (DUF421 family)